MSDSGRRKQRTPGARKGGLSESAALAIVEESLKGASRRQVRLGIGDDACLLKPIADGLCWTVDACDEGSHYLLEWMKPEQIAHKSIHAAVSDLAAMGATPHSLLCHVTLSSRIDAPFFRRFTRGQAAVSRALECPIVGGNLSFGPRLSVVTTALGVIPGSRASTSRGGALRRDTARAGDELWLLGSVGLARLGLLLLRRGLGSGRGAVAQALAAFRTPQARVREGELLRGRASACMDVSDGLRRDGQTLSRASGVRIVIEAARLEELWPRSVRQLALRLGEDPLEVALEGGEDYALLATGASGLRPPGARVIGRVERGRGAYVERGGRSVRLRGGFEHGA